MAKRAQQSKVSSVPAPQVGARPTRQRTKIKPANEVLPNSVDLTSTDPLSCATLQTASTLPSQDADITTASQSSKLTISKAIKKAMRKAVTALPSKAKTPSARPSKVKAVTARAPKAKTPSERPSARPSKAKSVVAKPTTKSAKTNIAKTPRKTKATVQKVDAAPPATVHKVDAAPPATETAPQADEFNVDQFLERNKDAIFGLFEDFCKTVTKQILANVNNQNQ